MNQYLKVLIIEDHPVSVEAYTNALHHFASTLSDVTFTVESANNCDNALQKIENAKSNFYDLIFLDISLPPTKNGKIISGEGLGERIRSYSNKAKIIVCTSHTEAYRLNNILKTIDPEGFIIKTDIGFQGIVNAIEIVLTDPPYYSKTVIQLLRLNMSKEMILNAVDRQLLYQLSIGTKTKDLPKILPLSITGVERRKKLLKKGLNCNSTDEFSLIKIAKERGYI